MALRLGEHVIRGEIFNVKPYSTHGWIEIEGEEMPLVFELTGDCMPDIQGKRVHFTADPVHEWEKPKPLDPALAKSIQWRQIGPTGAITADDWVRALPCPVEEFVARCRLGEMPPTTWKRRFYMEWYSQNGRVVIELAGAIVETCKRAPDRRVEDDDGEWEPLPMTRPAPPDPADQSDQSDPSDLSDLSDASGAPDGCLEITSIQRDGDEFTVETHRYPAAKDDDPSDGGFGESGDRRCGACPSGPDDLQRLLDAAAADTDRRAGIGDPEGDAITAELELMDRLMESDDGKRILFCIDDPEKLPDPDALNDSQVEVALKSLLGQLALYHIALHICPHYTPRDAYRLLVDTILIECHAHPELRGTGWVQNYMTSEYCKACDAEMEAEFEEMDRENEARAEGDCGPIGEPPF